MSQLNGQLAEFYSTHSHYHEPSSHCQVCPPGFVFCSYDKKRYSFIFRSIWSTMKAQYYIDIIYIYYTATTTSPPPPNAKFVLRVLFSVPMTKKKTRASRLYWAFLELSIFVQLSSQIRCYFNCFVKFLSWIWQISQIRCFLVSSKELWEVLHPVAGRDLSPLPAVTSICDLLAVKRTYPLNQPTATHITNQPTNQPYNRGTE